MNLTQAELQHRVETLITNGQLPQAQAILAGIGYSPEVLTDGQTMLDGWRAGRSRAKNLLAQQKEATLAEKEARQAVNQTITDFRRTVRLLFADDIPLLTTLGWYYPARGSNGSSNGTDDAATPESNGNGHGRTGRRPRKVSELVDYGRLLFTNAQALEQSYLEQLAAKGWNSERLAQAAAQVEQVAEADIVQQQCIRDYRAEMQLVKNAESDLRRWYHQGISFIKLSIKRADPENREQMTKLLGLE